MNKAWGIGREKGGIPCLVRDRNTIPSYPEPISKKRGKSCESNDPPTVKPKELDWPYYWGKTPTSPTVSWHAVWAERACGCKNGENAGSKEGSPSKTILGRDARRFFPSKQIAVIKGVACELPAQRNEPLSRLFIADIRRIVIAEKHVEAISTSTIWRILDADALKPWRRRSWIWSRDPHFFERAAPVLDLYQGMWQGRRLRSDEFVISADEKTSIQARIRLHATEIHRDGRGQRVEHEYDRGGAWAYLAAWDVRRAKIMGRVEPSNGKAPFDRLVAQVMNREPYASARRVFWIVDQGSSHRPTTFPDRLREQFRNATAVILPVHASWLNQIEIYFSILERKALTPNDFSGLPAVAERIGNFGKLFMRTAEPFNWNFTREDLRTLLKKLPNLVLDQKAVHHKKSHPLRAAG